MDMQKIAEAEAKLDGMIKEAKFWAENALPEQRQEYYRAKLEIFKTVQNALGTDSNFMFLDIREESAQKDYDHMMKSYRHESRLKEIYSYDGTMYAIKLCRRILQEAGVLE